jgi:hypothetical protein
VRDISLEEIEQQERQAVSDAMCRIDDATAVLLRAAGELQHYRSMMEHESTLAQKADYVNWAILHIANNTVGNCKLDRLATAQCHLLKVHELRRHFSVKREPIQETAK